MAGGGYDRHAQGVRQPGGASPDGAGQGPVLGSRFLLSRASRRSDQTVVVGRRWVVPVRQAAGAGTVCMAARRSGRGGADAGAIVDATGGDRLETAGAHEPTAAGRLRLRQFDSPYG